MALALTTMFLSGCVTVPSNACPQEVVYTRQQMEAADMERAEINEKLGRVGIITGLFMPDYGRLRNQSRACRGEKVPN